MDEFKNAPIQRHRSLAPLSRDHYASLVQAQHLIKAGNPAVHDDVSRRKVVAQFMDVWNNEIQPHFEDEERLLLELMNPDQKRRMLEDHQLIREDAAVIHAMRKEISPDPAVLLGAGTRLDEHVRWEERELFNELQESLSEEELTKLTQKADELEASRKRHVSCKPSN